MVKGQLVPYKEVEVHNDPGSPSSPETTLWVGAVSFEERCVGSLARLVEAGQAPELALLFEYPTNVHPVAEDNERRERNRTRVAAIRHASPGMDVRFTEVDPYSYRAAQRAVSNAVNESGSMRVVLDVSCLTKIHTVALADPGVFVASTHWQLAYTVPETYGHLESSGGTGPGWRDVLVLPIGDSAELVNETHARGVILAGHEGDRLIIALTETEPAGGVLITAAADRRPDLRRESERRNDKVSQLLLARGDDRWRRATISLRDPRSLADAIDAQISGALAEEAPVLLYPFGPKPFVALSAMQMATNPGLQAWFVYPIPSSYDVDYSYGTGATLWYRPREANDKQEHLALAL